MATKIPDPALTRHAFQFQPDDGTRLPCRNGRRTEYHEPATGLRLRVSPTGARSWAVSYWSPITKVQRRLRLGDAASVPLSKARVLARARLAEVDAGRDPFIDRAGQRDAERAA